MRTVIYIALAWIGVVSADTVMAMDYRLELVDGFQITRFPGEAPTLTLHHATMTDVTQVGYDDWVVVGTLHQKCFIIKRGQDFDRVLPGETLEWYDTKEAWLSRLKELGIDTPPLLHDPDEMATTRPGREVRPWRYERMHGRGDLSDDGWGMIIVFAAMLLAAVVGLFMPGKRSRRAVAAVIGLAAAVAGPIMIGEGGGPGFVGLFAWPLTAVLFAGAGAALRRAVIYLLARR
jgi:hypothetical protein